MRTLTRLAYYDPTPLALGPPSSPILKPLASRSRSPSASQTPSLSSNIFDSKPIAYAPSSNSTPSQRPSAPRPRSPSSSRALTMDVSPTRRPSNSRARSPSISRAPSPSSDPKPLAYASSSSRATSPAISQTPSPSSNISDPTAAPPSSSSPSQRPSTSRSINRFRSPSYVSRTPSHSPMPKKRVSFVLPTDTQTTKAAEVVNHIASAIEDPTFEVGDYRLRGVNTNTNREFFRKIHDRRTHKCRSRPVTLAWFEFEALRLLAGPPEPARHLHDLQEGDLFVNWLDKDHSECQAWEYAMRNGVWTWRPMRWGGRREVCRELRLVITPSGQPSMVEESTWNKKYRPKAPRIVNVV